MKVKYFSHIHHSYENHLEDEELENMINEALDDLNLPDAKIKSIALTSSHTQVKGDDAAHVHDILIVYDD